MGQPVGAPTDGSPKVPNDVSCHWPSSPLGGVSENNQLVFAEDIRGYVTVGGNGLEEFSATASPEGELVVAEIGRAHV